MSSTINPEATLASLRNNGTKIIAIGSSMLTVAVTCVGLRLTAKFLNEKAFGIDDLLIGLSLLFYLATESLVLRGQFLQVFEENLQLTTLELSLLAGKATIIFGVIRDILTFFEELRSLSMIKAMSSLLSLRPSTPCSIGLW